MNCGFDGCSSGATLHLTLVEQGPGARFRASCPAHAGSLLQALSSSAHATPSTSRTANEAEVRLALVLYDAGKGSSSTYLQGAEEPAWLRIEAAFTEAARLHHLLTRAGRFVRPVTHRAFLDAVEALGGRLEGLLMDGLYEPAGVFFAKLVLRAIHSSGGVLADVRPSDAIALSPLSGAPIMVRGPVLAAAEGLGWGAGGQPGGSLWGPTCDPDARRRPRPSRGGTSAESGAMASARSMAIRPAPPGQ